MLKYLCAVLVLLTLGAVTGGAPSLFAHLNVAGLDRVVIFRMRGDVEHIASLTPKQVTAGFTDLAEFSAFDKYQMFAFKAALENAPVVDETCTDHDFDARWVIVGESKSGDRLFEIALQEGGVGCTEINGKKVVLGKSFYTYLMRSFSFMNYTTL